MGSRFLWYAQKATHAAEAYFRKGDLCEAFFKSRSALSLLQYLDGDDRVSADAQIQIKSLRQLSGNLLAQVELHPDWKKYHADRMERLDRQAKEDVRLMVEGFDASAESAMKAEIWIPE